MSDQDWSEVYRKCLDAEDAHRHEGSCLFPQWSQFEDNLTPTEKAWFRCG